LEDMGGEWLEVKDEMFQAQRVGHDKVIIAIGAVPGYRSIEHKARYFGFPLYNIQDESDLDVWRHTKVIARHG
ncbi:MAG: hypothetical protein ACWGO1_02255, partial [Anaerolineales bacterium]